MNAGWSSNSGYSLLEGLRALAQTISYEVRLAGGRQHRRCIIPQTVTHSLVLLKMGKIISRNMLS
jgi:hypothetical protein